MSAGLGDAREAALLGSLRVEADGLAGEMVLGHLCQTAQACICSRETHVLSLTFATALHFSPL